MKKLLSMTFLSFMCIYYSNGVNAGLFDQLKKDLSKMQEQVEGLQQGNNLPKIETPTNNNSMSSSNSGTMAASSNAGGAPGEAEVEYLCRQHWQTGKVNPATVFKNLPNGNIKLLESDFSLSMDALDLTINNPRKKGGDSEIASLALYTNAYETGEMAYVFDQFLKTKGKKLEYLSIIKQVADSKAGYTADKQALKRDAQQMYGVILLYYNAKGADGFSYLKAASKGDVAKAPISTYHIAHRAYFGIEEGRDLSKAANWMLKSFNAVEKRQSDANANKTAIPIGREFVQLVKNEFYRLVDEPEYGRRDMYRDLIQQAKQMQASMEQQMQNSAGQVPDITNLTKAFLKKEKIVQIKILRSIGDEERAGQEEQLLQKFVDDKNLDDQKNDDFSWMSTQTQSYIEEGLASVNSLDEGEKREFVEAMGDLGSLMTEMNEIKLGLATRMLAGEINLMQFASAGPIISGLITGCELYDSLMDVGTKVGAPIGEVTFSDDDTIVEDSFDLGS